MLGQSAAHIGDQLIAGDLPGARRSLPTLVGRDPTNLNPPELARAVIESVAENTVDAVTATLFFGLIGGPTSVICHRVSNTLDAMVGHRTPRYENFGWASARLDDVLAAVPARLTVVALMMVRPRKARSILHTVRNDAWRHPSPNGGLVEAGFACALDLRLGGENSYGGIMEDRGTLGTGGHPEPADIARAVRLSSHVSVLFVAVPLLASAGIRLFKACILSHSHLPSPS
jgi:adenosylcobinamide-phosphate synthase